MSKTLCLDFGNTNKKYAVYDDGTLTASNIFKNNDTEQVKNILQETKPKKIILSSVVNYDAEWDKLFSEQGSFHKLSMKSKLPFTTPVAQPDTIGADRIALITAAVKKFPNSHSLIISSGTCITYNFINNENEFLGGSISPGIKLRFKSLNEHTDTLPLVEPEYSIPLIGYNTKTNITSGVVLGLCFEIEATIVAYKSKYKKLNVLLTGGDLDILNYHLRSKVDVDANFLMEGLSYLSEMN